MPPHDGLDSPPVVHPSRYAYGDTLAHLSAAIVAAGSTLFAKLDQSAAAQTVGLHLRPTTLLIFGNPKGGTPLMDASPLIALELPLRLLVWEENGTVQVAYVPLSTAAKRYGLNGDDPRLAGLDRALEAVVAAISL